jgi:hypothetical protein
MTVINFFHPLTPEQVVSIERLCSCHVDRILVGSSQVDQAAGLVEQVRAMLDALNLSPEEWQVEPMLVVLPALSHSSAVMLADIHGRMGHFPTVVRISPIPGTVPTRYDAVELIDLQQVRDAGRAARSR